MSISVGTPVLKLDRVKGYHKSKHSGSASAVLKEMFPDKDGLRHTADEDYNPKLTENNLYFAYDYEEKTFKKKKVLHSEEIVEKYYSEAEAYKTVYSDGRKKSLREDAVICVAGIIKPSIESEEWYAFDEKQKIKFLQVTFEEQSKLLKKRGIQVEFFTFHMDEANPHIHWVGKDSTYQMGKKVGLKMFNDFNKVLPTKLQSKGYDVAILGSFDSEAYKNMSEEEKNEYIKEKKAKKKEHGQNSRKYKAEQKKKDILAEAERLKNEYEKKNAEVEKQLNEATVTKQYLDEVSENIDKYKLELQDVLRLANKQIDSNQLKIEERQELEATITKIEKLQEEAPEKLEAEEIKEIVETRAEHNKQVDKEDTNRYAEKKKPIKKKSIPVREVPQSLEKARRYDISFNK